MAVEPTTASFTYSGSKASGSPTRSIKIVAPGNNTRAPQTYETTLSGGAYTSGNPLMDQIMLLVDTQVSNGSTSGTISLVVT